LLQEKRQALFTQAVTKGLDPNVPMKDSGVEWLGEIPSHWEVLSLTRVVKRFVDYRGRTPEKVDEGVPLITAGAVRNGRIDHARAPEYVTEGVYRHLIERGTPVVGDILFTSEAPLGEVGLVEDPRIACAQRIIMFKVDRTVMDPAFLLLFLLSLPGRTEIASRASGSTAEGIRADRLRMASIPVPPLSEQERAAAWISRAVANHEPLETLISRHIERLREYRQALITEAVTGKLCFPAEPA
jgi:type I restriction enzyme, S subunit